MAVDKGGLRYSIETPYDGSGLAKFIADTVKAREEIEKTKAAARTGLATPGAANAAREAAGAKRDEAEATKAVTNEERKKARVLSAQERAEKRYRDAIRGRIRVFRQAVAAQERNFVLERRYLTMVEARQRAEQRLTRTLDKAKAAKALSQVVQKRGITLTLQEKKALGLLSDVERARLRLQESLAAKQAVLGNSENRRLDIANTLEAKRLSLIRQQALAKDATLLKLEAENEALRRRNKVARDAAVADILRSQGFDAQGRKIEEKSLSQRIREFLGLADAADTADRSANRVSFTFRRLFGILAAFTAVRLAIRAFAGLVGQTIRLNAQLESAELGVAALFTAVSQVRDSTGELASGPEALEVATSEARRQIQLLRRDALQTTATFEQLVDTYQIAIAPGLQAGLDVDEIRKFTVQISQAAQAIGLEQNMLAEEIRSLLSGTIQQRTTRIAVALGITNDDIRRAREAGVLFEFLSDRFSAFTVAGERTLSTFNGIINRVRDGFNLLLQSGGLAFFDSLKDLLSDIFDAITNQEPLTGILVPDDGALRVVQIISEALQFAVLEAQRLGRALDFGSLEIAAQLFSGTLRAIVFLAGSLIEGLIRGVDVVIKTLSIIPAIVGLIPEPLQVFALQALRTALVALTATLVVIKSYAISIGLIRIATLAWGKALGLVQKALGLIASKMALVNLGFLPILLPALAFVTALAAAAGVLAVMFEYLRNIASQVTGVNLKLSTVAKILLTIGGYVVNSIITPIFGLVVDLVSLVTVSATAISKTLIDTARKTINLLALVPGAVGAPFRKAAQALNQSLDGVDAGVTGLLASAEALEAGLRGSLAAWEAQQIAAGDLDKRIGQILANAKDDPTAGELAKSLAGQVSEAVNSVVGSVISGLAGGVGLAGDEARSLSATFEDLPSIISRSVDQTSEQAAALKEVRDEAERASEQLARSVRLFGIEDTPASAIQQALEAEFEIRRANKTLLDQEQELQQQLGGVLRDQEALQRSKASLTENEQKALSQIEKINQNIQRAQSNLRKAEIQAGLQRQIQARAVAEGETEAAEAAARQLGVYEEQIRGSKALIEANKEAADSLVGNLGSTTAEQGNILRLGRQTIILLGQEKALRDQITQSQDGQTEAAEILNSQAAARIRQLSQEIAIERVRDALRNREVIAQRNLQAVADRGGLSAGQKEIAALRVELVLLQSRTSLARALRANSEQQLQTQIRQTGDVSTRLSLEQELVAFRRDSLGAALEEESAIKGINDQIALTTSRTRTFLGGVEGGAANFIDQFGDIGTLASQATNTALQGVGSTLSTEIVNAIDPFTNANAAQAAYNLARAIGGGFIEVLVNNFLATLLQQIGFAGAGLSTSSQLAAAALAAGGASAGQQLVAAAFIAADIIAGGAIGAGVSVQTAFGIAAGEISAGGAIAATTVSSGGVAGGAALAEGGVVAGTAAGAGGAAGGAAFSAALLPLLGILGIVGLVAVSSGGFAEGGEIPDAGAPHRVRPKGLDRRDTVPIWAQPGEFMLPFNVSRQIGYDALESIRRGQFDPQKLRDAVGRSSKPKRQMYARLTKIGYADGGAIGRIASSSSSGAPSGGGGGATLIPVLIADRNSAEDLLGSGLGEAMMSYLSKRSSELRGIVGRS